MSVWGYDNQSSNEDLVRRAFKAERCFFCHEPLFHLTKNVRDLIVGGSSFASYDTANLAYDERNVYTCPVCGWWTVRSTVIAACTGAVSSFTSGAAGILRELDVSDIETPLEAVRSYLAAKFDRRFDVAPRLFEETVASVFRDLGFATRVTAYSGDGGIDVVLDGADGEVIGVQVKRYQRTIKVEQLRALTGALVVGGLTRGIFVTTSTFQKGSKALVQGLPQHGYQIELIDAARFYDALKIAQRSRYIYKDDPDAPYTRAELMDLDSANFTM